MKTTTLVLILFLTALASRAQPTSSPRRFPQRANVATNAPAAPAVPPVPGAPPPAAAPDAPSAPSAAPAAAPSVPDAPAAPAAPKPPEEMMPVGSINFQGVDVNQVLDVYAKLVGRTMLRAGLPTAQIILHTETPLTKSEAIQALQAVLALNGIALVNVGDKFVKVLPVDQANSAGAALDRSEASQLPDLGTYVTHIVQLKYIKPSLMVPIIQPFAKLANSILPIDDNGILVLRDNAENVKRMLEMIDQVDVSVPAEYISEVIPIKYALAEDIANALNSLGGGGNATVSIGSSGAAQSISGLGTRTSGTTTPGAGGTSQYGANQPNQPRTTGAPTTGTPTRSGTFSDRLQRLVSRAGAGTTEQIQIFGQTKIIADQRSNSLLVFATRPDMDRIKEVIGKLDVLLAQVLIEAVIMDVSFGHSWNLGVSAAQNPKTLGSTGGTNGSIIGGGGMNNGQSFYDFAKGIFGTSNSSSTFANSLPSGLSYFGNIGPNWDVAVQAAEADSTTTIIQRPRIQTSQAKQAQFFVGQTVPYITGYYNNGYGNNSSYSQLSVGIELDVTPFINPDGLVVMDINQEIDDLGDAVKIDGNDVYKTVKRTLSSEIAVRDKDTIILGGFIRTDKSKSKSGVPLLQDIPLLGNLFTSRSDNKNRQELIVLMRPTVLRTPEIASAQTIKEQQRLPGVSAALAEDAAYERRLVENQRKTELKRAKVKGQASGFFTPAPSGAATDTNNATLLNP
jgi:general secretion pathway protein D